MADLDTLGVIERQYGASLAMLGHAIELCSDDLWLSENHRNRFWHIAYHVLFYTHLYVQPAHSDFKSWPKHRQDYQYLGPRPGAPEETQRAEIPYSKPEMLEYHEFCRGEVAARVPSLDLNAPSGFDWLPFNKLELQFYNIRHIHHHTGQLADRLRASAQVGLAWVRL